MSNFTSFAFKATGGSANRTMPDRLIDVVNVKDWGAVGDGAADDTTPIRNAIAYAFVPTNRPNSSRYGSIVYFPPGTYRITGALNCHQPSGKISLIGAGRSASTIIGSINGNMIADDTIGQSGGLACVADLKIWNTSSNSAARCIYIREINNFVIHHCHFIGMNCVNWDASFDGAMSTTICECSAPIGAADSAAPGAEIWHGGGIFCGRSNLELPVL